MTFCIMNEANAKRDLDADQCVVVVVFIVSVFAYKHNP